MDHPLYTPVQSLEHQDNPRALETASGAPGAGADQHQKQTALLESLVRQQEALHAKRLQLIKAIAETEHANDDNARIIRYAAMSIQVLTEFKIRLQREKI